MTLPRHVAVMCILCSPGCLKRVESDASGRPWRVSRVHLKCAAVAFTVALALSTSVRATAHDPAPAAASHASSLASVAAVVEAQREAEEIADLPPFRLRASLALWLPSLGGDWKVGGQGQGNSSIEVEGDFGLDDNEPVPAVDVVVEFPAGSDLERWRFGLHAWAYEGESTDRIDRDLVFAGVTAPAGSILANDVGLTSVQATVAYDLFGDLAGSPTDPGELRVFAVGGVRGFNVDHRIVAVGAGGPEYVDYDRWASAVELGLLFDLELLADDIVLPGKFDVRTGIMGGVGLFSDADITTFAIEAAISWRPVEHLGLTFGYRHLDFNLEDDDARPRYQFDQARLAGVFFNAVFEF